MYEVEVQIYLMYRQNSFYVVKIVTLQRSTKKLIYKQIKILENEEYS